MLYVLLFSSVKKCWLFEICILPRPVKVQIWGMLLIIMWLALNVTSLCWELVYGVMLLIPAYTSLIVALVIHYNDEIWVSKSWRPCFFQFHHKCFSYLVPLYLHTCAMNLRHYQYFNSYSAKIGWQICIRKLFWVSLLSLYGGKKLTIYWQMWITGQPP